MRLPIWLSLDIEPVPAMTGLQALELMEQYRFDLIITDIRMPEMDGLEFISQMRKVYPDIPTVVLSGYDSFAYAKEAIHYGVSDYLLKPISQLDLSDTITRIFHEIEEKKEARQQEEMLRGTVKQTIRDANAQQLENGLLGGPEMAVLTGFWAPVISWRSVFPARGRKKIWEVSIYSWKT